MIDFADNFFEGLYKKISELHSEDIPTGYNIFWCLKYRKKKLSCVGCYMIF
jgi:hypothetical protein